MGFVTGPIILQHVRRANYQAGIWRKCLVAKPNIPEPDGHDWTGTGDGTLEIKAKPFLYNIHGIEHCPVAGIVDPKFFKKSLSYEPDPSDVFLATYPKCGTTWCQAIVDLLMNDGESTITGLQVMFNTLMEHFEEASSHFLEYFAGKEGIKQLPKPRWVKTHLPFDLAPYNNETKYICVARNPFDCCVSFYFHQHGLNIYDYNGTFDEFFEIFINGQVDMGDYFHHVNSWYAHKDDENILLLTYEEMKEDAAKAVIKMGNFIGGKCAELVKDEAKVSDIVTKTSFDSMTKFNALLKDKPEICKEDFKFMRKGKVSDFRNYFKKEQYDRLKEKYDSALKATTLHQYWAKFIEFE
ncbi:Sulfotransferase 1C2 [Nymphon striatum]|nr:Sulfotransferase 1C2 [Nymphon striatum]